MQVLLLFRLLVFCEGGKPENQEKNPRSKARANNRQSTHIRYWAGIEPKQNWWEPSALIKCCANSASFSELAKLLNQKKCRCNVFPPLSPRFLSR